MKYTNSSKGTIRIAENAFLPPGGEIDLTDDDLKRPEIIKMKNWDWLIPVAENVIGDFIDHQSTNLGDEDEKKAHAALIDDATKNKAIDEAIKRSATQKAETSRTWNPMDDAAPLGEPDYLGPPKAVNTATQYGNAELTFDATSQPVAHMGGGSDDEPDANPTGKVGVVPHHPDDLAKYNVPPPPPPSPAAEPDAPVNINKPSPARKPSPRKKK